MDNFPIVIFYLKYVVFFATAPAKGKFRKRHLEYIQYMCLFFKILLHIDLIGLGSR